METEILSSVNLHLSQDTFFFIHLKTLKPFSAHGPHDTGSTGWMGPQTLICHLGQGYGSSLLSHYLAPAPPGSLSPRLNTSLYFLAHVTLEKLPVIYLTYPRIYFCFSFKISNLSYKVSAR